jgi:hypothetical protein
MQRSSIVLMSAGAALTASALALAAYAAPSKANATSPVGARVDNFMLADQTGMGHELYYFKDADAVVIVSTRAGDPASEKAAAALKHVRNAFKGRNIHFVMLDSTPGERPLAGTPGSADMPVLADARQWVGRSLGVMQTGEAFVVNPKTWTVVYHGPIDASFAPKKKQKANLADALNAVLAGQPVAIAEGAVKGAAIAFPDRARAGEFAKISYARDVAPVLAEKCVSCHTKGGMAPFAMDRYETVKGFAPMIREALRTQRMPPYHSDNHGARWTDDMRPTDAQLNTLVNWIEAGAPRGDGVDPLPTSQPTIEEWPLGKPDLIVDVPAFTVPASGVIDYQDWSVASKLPEGKWLKTTAWKAGATPVVHHALAGWMPEVRADGRGFSWNTSLGGYGPGGEANTTPADTGIYIPPGGSFAYQMHYTPVGKEMRDATQVGYYFYAEKPKYILRQISITDFSLEIPAGKARHHETAYLEFPKDALIYGTQPHCHSRCYSTKLRIRYPDGTEKVLLNQPRYDFGWQREYHFDGMLEVPAGSKLIADYIFDNSTANKANPDPSHNVTFGEQTSEEMLFTFARFRFKDETVDNRHDEWFKELQTNITIGALDDDMDGKLTAAEFRNDPRFKPVVQYLPMVDSDKDGTLSKAEFLNALQIMQKMRANGTAPAAPKMDKGAAAMTQQN